VVDEVEAALLVLTSAVMLGGAVLHRAPAKAPPAALLPSVKRFAPAPPPAALALRLPLEMASAWQDLARDGGEAHLLVLRLDKRSLDAQRDRLIELIAKGRAHSRREAPPTSDFWPRAGSDVGLYLVGPNCSYGENWAPVELRRQGNTFTLFVESWRDGHPRTRNAVRRPTYLLRLPGSATLRAGDYRLELIWRDFYQETGTESPCYPLRSTLTGGVRFRLAAPVEAIPRNASLPALREASLAKARPSAAEARASWQPTSEAAGFDLRLQRDLRRGLSVGALDLKMWRESGVVRVAQSVRALEPPVLAKPRANDRIVASILGPNLSSLEAMTQRAVAWQGKAVTLHVDLWRDDGDRAENMISTPLLLVPLELPRKVVDGRRAALPGAYTVRVEWVFLRAKRWDEPYQIESPPAGRAPAWMRELRNNNTASFVMPKP
jgi:hypothetical protein